MDVITDNDEVLTVFECGCTTIDVGYAINEGTIFWPSDALDTFSLCMSLEFDEVTGNFYAAGVLRCPEHGGTHVDAPYHFSRNGKKIDEIRLKQLIAPLRIVDIPLEHHSDPDYTIQKADIERHEKLYGPIHQGTIVFFRTTWHVKYSLGAKEYLGFDVKTDGPYDTAVSSLRFPGIGVEAAVYLVDLKVSGVGIDTASLDAGSNRNFDSHKILLGNGVYGVENISGAIDRVPNRGATVVILPMKLSGGSGAPARVVVLVKV